MSIADLKNNVQGSFDKIEQKLNGASAGPLHTLRKSALEQFQDVGIPTPRNEEWKYTNVIPLFAEGYRSSVENQNQTLQDGFDKEFASAVNSIAATLPDGTSTVALINGVYDSSLSLIADTEGVSIEPLTDDLVASDADVREALSSMAPLESHPFIALNTALSVSGVVIRVAANIQVAAPVHIAIVDDASDAAIMSNTRVLVIADKSSSIDVIESHHTIGSNNALNVSVAELLAQANSEIRYTKINDDTGNGKHISFIGAHVMRDAVVKTSAFALDGAFVRNDLNIKLVEEGANAYLDGVSVLDGDQFADNHTVVDHTVAHCHSEELYKGVYADKSVGVFNGKIFVRQDAQKTTAYQSNHSLLLSDRAKVNAKPQLEIWADDVKCSHGATTGQLNEEAVFYLRSRGVAEAEARSLMTYAFAAEVVDRVHLNGLRDHLQKRVANKLGSEPFEDALEI